jgi:hypothetical protein
VGSIVFLSQNCIEGTENSHENLIHDTRASSRESNPRPPVQEVAVLVANPRHFVNFCISFSEVLCTECGHNNVMQ